MAKYYWLKLKDDFFQQKKIKKLRKIAGGDTYTIIYLKLQLLSLSHEGKIFFEGIEETFAEELALTLDEDEENVSVTLLYLKNQGLIEMVAQDEYVLPETISAIGGETDSAQRVRRHREKQKMLQCNAIETKSNTEIEIEIEKREEIDNVATAVATCNRIPAEKSLTKSEGAQPKKVGKDGYTKDFESFWALYPRRIEKRNAFRVWQTRLKEKVDPKALITAATNYAESCRMKNTQAQFIKHAATFLGPAKPYEEFISRIPESELKTDKMQNAYEQAWNNLDQEGLLTR